MIADDDVSAHPGMDFANDLDRAGSHQGLAARLTRIKADIELRLPTGEQSVRRV